MAATTFSKILDDAKRSGQRPGPASSDWFRTVARNTRLTPEKLMKEQKAALVTDVQVGSMYAFFYDPKHKKTLPYYDRFPLIFPIGPAEGGFLGINFHYLPYRIRAALMDALWGIASNKRIDPTTRLRLSYDVLQASSKFKWAKFCIKHYLLTHVKSRFVFIAPEAWEIAIMLPMGRFEKRSQQKAWSDVMRKA
jgi:hypothetical protein